MPERIKRVRLMSKFNQIIAIYIALMVTVLAGGVWESVGTNTDQNKQIATQAEALAASNHKALSEGCARGNFVRVKINVISGVLSGLLHKSIEEADAKGEALTPDQEVFINRQFRRLAPLNPVDCKKKYPSPPRVE